MNLSRRSFVRGLVALAAMPFAKLVPNTFVGVSLADEVISPTESPFMTATKVKASFDEWRMDASGQWNHIFTTSQGQTYLNGALQLSDGSMPSE